jgi:hypothetical protein
MKNRRKYKADLFTVKEKSQINFIFFNQQNQKQDNGQADKILIKKIQKNLVINELFYQYKRDSSDRSKKLPP